MNTIKFAVAALITIASSSAFATGFESNQPMDLDLAVAIESAKSDLSSAREEMVDSGAQTEIARAPASERMIIVIGDES